MNNVTMDLAKYDYFKECEQQLKELKKASHVIYDRYGEKTFICNSDTDLETKLNELVESKLEILLLGADKKLRDTSRYYEAKIKDLETKLNALKYSTEPSSKLRWW